MIKQRRKMTDEEIAFANEIIDNGEVIYEFYFALTSVTIFKYENVMYTVQFISNGFIGNRIIYDMYTIG